MPPCLELSVFHCCCGRDDPTWYGVQLRAIATCVPNNVDPPGSSTFAAVIADRTRVQRTTGAELSSRSTVMTQAHPVRILSLPVCSKYCASKCPFATFSAPFAPVVCQQPFLGMCVQVSVNTRSDATCDLAEGSRGRGRGATATKAKRRLCRAEHNCWSR